MLVANKAEGPGESRASTRRTALGLGEPVPISAEHGEGLGDLHDALLAVRIPDMKTRGDDTSRQAKSPRRRHRAAERRQVDADQPHHRRGAAADRAGGRHHRDSIAIDWTFRDRALASSIPPASAGRRGLTASSRSSRSATRFAPSASPRSILVLDVEQPFEKQDLQIADLVESEGRAIVIALDKWDLVRERQSGWPTPREGSERLLPQIRGVPLVPVSGRDRRGDRQADGNGGQVT